MESDILHTIFTDTVKSKNLRLLLKKDYIYIFFKSSENLVKHLKVFLFLIVALELA